MKRIRLLLAAVAAMVGLSVNAQLTNGTVYWIQDTGTGQFLSQGDDWSTKAVMKDVGGLGFEAVYISDGVYKLQNVHWYNATNEAKGLGAAQYVDQDMAEYTLTASGEGYLISTGANYLVNNGTENAYKEKPIGTTTDAASASIFKFLTKAEYDAAIQAYKDANASSYATTMGYNVNTESALESLINDANQFISKDYTSSISNPTIGTNWDGWTHGNISQRGEGAGVGSGCAEFWNGCGYAKQTISNLPNGLYKVTFVGTYRPGNANTANKLESGKTSSPAFVYANDAKAEFLHWIDVPNKANARSGITAANGYSHTFYTYVSDGTLDLGVVADGWVGDGKQPWNPFGQFTLTYYTDQVSDEDATALIAAIPTRVSSKQTALLNAAKSTLEANKTIANYNALAAAITAAQTSANEYAIIDAGTVPTNAVAGWAISTTNGELAANTWSTEGNSDGSGMTTPFIQDWVAAGTPLAGGNAGGKLYYTFTDLNPGETYVVTARVRVFNESATGVTGATYFVGDNSKSLATFGSACTGDYAAKGVFAVLSCAGTVDSNGQLQFGVVLDSDSPINWMSIKDVTIAAGTGDVPESISLNESKLSLITGSTANLTATITPSTADDKTIIWSSSNEAVATVAGGYIVAVAPGTATITANAYAGDNVTATCTVTVADAAAPAFYSTEIVGGTDYYIMNAATGQFLGGGNSWGTQASLIEHGIPFGASKIEDGVYTLDSYTYNNTNDHFFSGTYVDGGATNLHITSLGNGKFSIDSPVTTGEGENAVTSYGNFITAGIASTVVTNNAKNSESTLAQWYFISKADRDKMLAAANAENPVDATYYIKQANISRNRSAGGYNVNAWSQYSVEGSQDNTNFAAQVYNAAVDNYQTIENIPNGTYIVSVQAFTSGTDVKFYANDQEVAVRANDSGVASCSGAAALFAQDRYPNTVTVTVTDRTMKIGFKGDCSGNKWLCYDKFEMVMTGYTANTGVSASIDKDEIQIGQTANISAETVPATASFNAITSYTSSDESIATVDANGVVTGVGVGSATITVTANEMENFSTTVDVTVKLVTPTSFELSETEVALDVENPSTTLTITTTPEGANDAATWVSSDETVATVVNGVVTGVSSGTATITATSVVDAEVSAQATVTVAFPESAAPEEYYVNNGAARTLYAIGENLFKNGTFEYPTALAGWKVGKTVSGKGYPYTVDANISNFVYNETGGVNNGAYITTNGAGNGSEKSLCRAIPVEVGKTYYFSVYTSGKAPSSGNIKYNALFKMSDATTEAGTIKEFEWPQGAGNTTSEWSKTEYVFTAETPYVGVRMSWNENSSFDEFVLVELTEDAVVGNAKYALDAIPAANIGENAFQYSQAAINAANALVQGEATVEDVENAYAALTTLNAPAEGQLFNIVNITDGFNHKGKALTFKSASDADLTQNTTSMGWTEEPGSVYSQAVKFTAVEGTKNGYKLSYTRADGNEIYISTGTLSGLGSDNNQIRPTNDVSKALTFVVTSVGDNHWYLMNTATGNNVGSNGDTGFYTAGGSNKDLRIQDAVNNVVALNIKAENQYGTIILPFDAEIPTGVTAYSVSETTGDVLNITQVQDGGFVANTPYIVFAEGGADTSLEGLGAAYSDATYTEGLLTGVYAETAAPEGSFVLQNNDNKVGFYLVAQGGQPTVGANHAYLTEEAGSRAAYFFGEGVTNGINAIEALTEGNVGIFNAAGVQQPRLQKGLNIVKKADGTSFKVMVK